MILKWLIPRESIVYSQSHNNCGHPYIILKSVCYDPQLIASTVRCIPNKINSGMFACLSGCFGSICLIIRTTSSSFIPSSSLLKLTSSFLVAALEASIGSSVSLCLPTSLSNSTHASVLNSNPVHSNFCLIYSPLRDVRFVFSAISSREPHSLLFTTWGLLIQTNNESMKPLLVPVHASNAKVFLR